MKVACFHDTNDVRIEQTPIPSVKFVGICRTDAHEYSHGTLIVPMKEPQPVNGHCGATIMRHEFSGVVVEVGENVCSGNDKPGD
ncbi:unnamed protein product [Adineta ricciae]|uniref:Alcohol dehydrogenase-like N-terminal domain-containing protein n=1 Tax=Adineta ricciae TaxID=249248 RepID=A0A815EHF8_ADIRI|nr:unnamed protein product [Adineta ricciae]CAF1315143.1 unnamed protein product [Adineta ricciae]